MGGGEGGLHASPPDAIARQRGSLAGRRGLAGWLAGERRWQLASASGWPRPIHVCANCMCNAAVGNSRHPGSSRQWARAAGCCARESAYKNRAAPRSSLLASLASPSGRLAQLSRASAPGSGAPAPDRSLSSATEAPCLPACLLPGNRPSPHHPSKGAAGSPLARNQLVGLAATPRQPRLGIHFLLFSSLLRQRKR